MGLQTFHINPWGQKILIDQDVLDIAGRLQRGDATCNWEGDPSLYVLFNQKTSKYEVWQHCVDNVERIILSRPPAEFDARVIKYIADNDNRRVNLFEEVMKYNEKVEADHAQKLQDAHDATADFVKFAARKLHLPGVD